MTSVTVDKHGALSIVCGLSIRRSPRRFPAVASFSPALTRSTHAVSESGHNGTLFRLFG